MDLNWLRDVVLIPLAMSIVTGIYTGFLVSRILAFNQEIQRARDRAYSCINVFQNVINAESETAAKEATIWLFFDISRAIYAQPAQRVAAEEMTKLSIKNQTAMLEHWRRSQAFIKAGRPISEYTRIVTEVSQIIVDETLSDIAKIRPNWGGLLVGCFWPQKRSKEI